MPELASSPERSLKIFISYSRKDLRRAELLCNQLVAKDYKGYLDKHDILPGEPWKERIAKLIEMADIVVFLISPDSLTSEICDWEVNEAERLGKRLLPVIIRDTPSNLVPGRLQRLNYIFMREGAEESEGFAALVNAAGTDIDWIREHTWLGQLAADWERNKRVTELLLRGNALSSAEFWISNRPPLGMAPTPLHREFIQTSKAEELSNAIKTGRIQVLIVILIAAFISGICYLVWLNRSHLEFQGRLVLDSFMPTVISISTERNLKAGESIKECASCPEMIVIPPGEFLMGSDYRDGSSSERPQHKVIIPRHVAISKFLITFDQWDACRSHGGCTHRPDDRGWGRGLLPVTDISWLDAKEYIAWLTKQTKKQYRLLSEAEWEYAARAGSGTKYPWGDTLDANRANCGGSGGAWDDKQPSPAGAFPPNAFGLHDMIGNLWEWVEDNWHSNYEGAPTDGSVWLAGDESLRITRGGSYAQTIGECYSAFRDFARPPDFRNYIFGFRVARELAQ